MSFLDEAIAILEQADRASRSPAGAAADKREELMDDLGHSMAPMPLAPMRLYNAFASRGAGWRSISVEESLRFFE